MKLSRFAKIVKQNGGALHLCHVSNGDIWIGTRFALYCARGMPETVDSATIKTILDFSRKEAEKIAVQEHYFDDVRDIFDLNLSDNFTLDIDTNKMSVSVVHKGTLATALLCDNGELIFFDERHLGPLVDILKESDYIRFVVRITPAGEPYVVVRNGLSVEAAIMPIKIINEVFLGDLEDFQARCIGQHLREEARLAVPQSGTGTDGAEGACENAEGETHT